MNNVYPEIGSSFGSLAIQHPVMCQHLMGKNIKHYGADHVIWGTDCLWWGSPQWVIDAFKRFQISDELCEKFGYKKLTKEDKAKIFGLKIYICLGKHSWLWPVPLSLLLFSVALALRASASTRRRRNRPLRNQARRGPISRSSFSSPAP